MLCIYSKKMLLVLILVTLFYYKTVLLFEQSDYKVIHERILLDSINHSYIQNATAVLFHYTRHEKRYNFSVLLKKDVGKNILGVGQAYKFQSNEYRLFPVLWTENLCDVARDDTFGTSPTHFESNCHRCPLKKGYYYVRNAGLDDSKLPPFVPRGRYMLELKIYLNKSIQLASIKWFVGIVPTNPLERVVMG